MTRPTSDPTWATDASFPAGSSSWSGRPNKSTPSSGKRGTGYTPRTARAAEEDNAIIGSHGDWIKYLDGLRSAGLFGDGSDGNVTIDGAAAGPTFAPLSLGQYQASHDIYCNSLTLTGTASLRMKGFRLFVRGVLTVGSGCAIHNDGNNATNSTPGASTPGGSMGIGASGAGGGTSASAGGGVAPALASGIGGLGGTGGLGDSTGVSIAGTPGGVISAPTAQMGGYRSLRSFQTGIAEGFPSGVATLTQINGGSGGGGGHYGADLSANASNGGGGGGGGGPLLVSASQVVNNGRIGSDGGRGGNAVAVSGGGNAGGGGGGGGGGDVWLTYGLLSGSSTVSANGGTGGLQQAGGGNGISGTGGVVMTMDLSA